MIENHHKKLQEAIDFFSQSLHVEQLMAYGYDLMHRVLELKQSALFLKRDMDYVLQIESEYHIPAFGEKVTPNHKALAERFGRVLTRDFDRYFSQELITTFRVALLIPIINKNELVGFIVSSGSQLGELDSELVDFAFAINQLMNKSYEHASAYSALESKNFELDKRVFNLFFINHSSRLLMSELNVGQLYHLCVDIIRELTASAVTSFFVFDEHEEKLIMRGYKNIIAFDQRYDELSIPQVPVANLKTIYHMEEDYTALQDLFGDLSVLQSLETEHVIFVVKERIIGVITVSKPVNSMPYDKTVLELIVSIANSIYIAMHNAMQFQKIENQRKALDAKVKSIEALNRSIKNIQACQSRDEVIEIVLQTLTYGFGVKRMAVYLQQGDDLACVGSLGYREVPKLEDLFPEKTRSKISLVTTAQAKEALDQSALAPGFIPEDMNCLLLLPIQMDVLTSEGELWFGAVYIDVLAHPIHPEDVLAFETLTNAIAPILYWQLDKANCQTNHTVKAKKRLQDALKKAVFAYEQHQVDYYVYIQKIDLTLSESLEYIEALEDRTDAILIGAYEVNITHHPYDSDSATCLLGSGYQETYEKIMSTLL